MKYRIGYSLFEAESDAAPEYEAEYEAESSTEAVEKFVAEMGDVAFIDYVKVKKS